MEEKYPQPLIDVEVVKKAFSVWKGVKVEAQSRASQVDYMPYHSRLVFIRLCNHTTGEWRLVAALPRPASGLEDAVAAALVEIHSSIAAGGIGVKDLVEKLLLLASLYRVEHFSIQINGSTGSVEIAMTAGYGRRAQVKVSDYFKLGFSLS